MFRPERFTDQDPSCVCAIVQADLDRADHQREVLQMMDAYAADPMGDGKPLSQFAREHLIDGLRAHRPTLVFLAFSGDQAVGIAVCFRGYSTFAAKPLIHVSDYYVDLRHRGKGIGSALLSRIEREARSEHCCKIVLEVQENNVRARSIYEAFGFSQAIYVREAGGALSMSKLLN